MQFVEKYGVIAVVAKAAERSKSVKNRNITKVKSEKDISLVTLRRAVSVLWMSSPGCKNTN